MIMPLRSTTTGSCTGSNAPSRRGPDNSLRELIRRGMLHHRPNERTSSLWALPAPQSSLSSSPSGVTSSTRRTLVDFLDEALLITGETVNEEEDHDESH